MTTTTTTTTITTIEVGRIFVVYGKRGENKKGEVNGSSGVRFSLAVDNESARHRARDRLSENV